MLRFRDALFSLDKTYEFTSRY